MSLVEGVGDEVLVLFSVIIVVLVLYAVWLSTQVTDHQFFRIILLDASRFHQYLQRLTRGTQTQTPSPSNEEHPDPDTPPQTESSDRKSSTDDTQSAGASEAKSSIRNLLSSGESQETSNDSEAGQGAVVTTPPVTSQSQPVISQTVLDSILSSAESTAPDTPDSAESDDPQSAGTQLASTQLPGTPCTETSGTPCTETSGTPCTATSGEDQPINSTDNTESNTSVQSSESPESPADVRVEELELQDGHIRIRLKYLDDRQRMVHAKPEDTIAHFKSTHFASELADHFSVRFIFGGRELREDLQTLQACNIEDNSVIHCLLSRITQQDTPNQIQQGQLVNFDLGVLIFPLFGLILGLIWYCRITYRNYFNAVSTLSLFGITLVYGIALLANFRREPHEHVE